MERNVNCRVCGKVAAGIHCTVLVCGGCKAFYRRAIRKKTSYFCATGNCSTQADKMTCKACRFKKCAASDLKSRVLPDQTKTKACSTSVKQDTKFRGHERREETVSHSPRQVEQLIRTVVSSLIPTTHVAVRSSTECIIPSTTAISHSRDLVRPALSFTTSPDQELSGDSSPQSWTSDGFSDKQSELEFSCQVPNLLTENNMLSVVPAHHNDFFPFLPECMGSLEANRRQMIRTASAVGAAVRLIFRDQFADWTACQNRGLARHRIPNQADMDLETMVLAVNKHNAEYVVRTRKLASMLPGMSNLRAEAKRSVTAGWKWLVYWMIHQSAFLTNTESYITVGQQQYHFCRYWQEQIIEQPVLQIMYKICTLIREIQLTETERYLLMAIVMFEPEEENESEPSLELQIIHRHYIDVLLDVIKQRSPDAVQLAVTCRKLQRFFSIFKIVSQLHLQYYSYKCQLDMVQAKARIVQLQADAATF